MKSIHKMQPINRTAGYVTSTGTHFNPDMKSHQREAVLEDLPPLISIPQNLENFTSIRFDRLVVIGFIGHGKWLCRCACGNHCTRKSKSIRRRALLSERTPTETRQMCAECEYVEYLKNQQHKREYGRYIDGNK